MSEVTPELHAYILDRDGFCFGYRMYGSNHICRDQWGNPHAAHEKLTLDHVKDDLQMGLRAPSDARHLVAMCARMNGKPPNKAERAAERQYLAEVEK
jgi:hypothetical protein